MPGSANNQVIFRLTNANGSGIANQPISIVAGSLGTTSAITDVNGNYTYVYHENAATAPVFATCTRTVDIKFVKTS